MGDVHEANYDEPEQPCVWCEWVMRALIVGAGVALLLLVGGPLL